MERGPQYNCHNEPAYLAHDTVVCCLTAPDLCVHRAAADCATEYPHPIAECGLFVEPPLTYFYDTKRHLVCLPYSRQNLHRMAAALGIKRCWYQISRGKAHYDIPKHKLCDVQQHCQLITERQVLHIILHGTLCEPTPTR